MVLIKSEEFKFPLNIKSILELFKLIAFSFLIVGYVYMTFSLLNFDSFVCTVL